MTTQVIMLNGGSSSGKTGIARCLQAVLPQPWLSLSVDTFVGALPAAMRSSGAGIEFADDGGGCRSAPRSANWRRHGSPGSRPWCVRARG